MFEGYRAKEISPEAVLQMKALGELRAT